MGRRTIDGLEADMDMALDDARDVGSDISDFAEDSVEAASQSVSHGLRRIEEALAGIYDSLSESGSKSVEVIGETVEDHPWTAVLASFAAGVALAMLLHRRR